MQLIPRSLNFYVNENGSKVLKLHGEDWIEIPINNSQAEILFDFSKEKYLCYVWNLVAWTYLNIPLNSQLIRKDGNELNNYYTNFEIFKEGNSGEKIKENTDENDKEENIEEVILKEEEYDHFFGDCKVPEPHEDFRRTFEPDVDEYNLDGCVDFFGDGKKWKQAYYFDQILKNHYISEDMQLYIMNRKHMKKTKLDQYGEKVGEGIIVNKKRKDLHLKDILASSFLKIPDGAKLVVYKTWNKETKQIKGEGKYRGQKDHYTNLHWITSDNMHLVSTKKGFENYWITNYGDVYLLTHYGYYLLIKEITSSNGLRVVAIGEKSNKFSIHELVGKYFSFKEESYKYYVHRNGDLSNNHYRNIVGLNTLGGIYNDGKMYHQIPKFPEYLISEDNLPYSFRYGTLSEMSLTINSTGYYMLLISIKNKTYNLIYSRVLMVTKGKGYYPGCVVDHKNRDRLDYSIDNLKCCTSSENAKNKEPRRSKRIQMMDLDGNVIKIFNAAKEASIQLEISKQLIQQCAVKNDNENNPLQMQSYKNYKWKYLDKYEIYQPKEGEIFKKMLVLCRGEFFICKHHIISNYGTLINENKGYAKFLSNDLYPMISFTDNGNHYNFGIHYLVALNFVEGRTEERNEVNHIDTNPQNYKADNLEWVTHKENMEHSSFKLFKPIKQISIETGEIINIFKSRKAAGEFFNVSNQTISRACNKPIRSSCGYKWSDLTNEELQIYLENQKNN